MPAPQCRTRYEPQYFSSVILGHILDSYPLASALCSEQWKTYSHPYSDPRIPRRKEEPQNLSLKRCSHKTELRGGLADDEERGVPSGVWEVRVEAKDKDAAERLIAANPIEDEMADVDQSHDLDLVTVFEAAGNSSEMEAMSVQAMLESNGIYAMTNADQRFPNLPEEVRVPRDKVDEAKRLIAEALAAGPAAADEAESSTE